ncbi:unnamed protein product [Allacma fusca]|uniref:Uncharacterized protein n=1 Tax=Allacma fusca TaxID=39272 RepID=A0A8J2KUE7_9HEXA|nr:unnamed protein product [Allacma fusca]
MGKIRDILNSVADRGRRLFQKRAERGSDKKKENAFYREFDSLLTDMSIVNYGTFYWDRKCQRLGPTTGTSKFIWSVVTCICASIMISYILALFHSKYMDVSSLEIRNMTVVSSDVLFIIVQLFMLALDVNLLYFNTQIIQYVNALMALNKHGRKEFKTSEVIRGSFVKLAKPMRIYRRGGYLLVLSYFLRETSAEIIFGSWGYFGRIVNAIIGLLIAGRFLVTTSFYIFIIVCHVDFLQFWLHQLLNSSEKDCTMRNLQSCMQFYQKLVIQQRLLDNAFGQFYLPVGMFLVSLYQQYSSCSKVYLLSQKFQNRLQMHSLQNMTEMRSIELLRKITKALIRSLQPISVKVGDFGMGSVRTFFRLTVEIGNFYILLMSLSKQN